MVLVTTSPPATPCPHRPSHLELGLQTFPALCVMKFTRRLASIARNMLLQRVLPLSFVLPLALQWQAGSSARCDARLIMFSGAPLSIISGTARACEHNCSHEQKQTCGIIHGTDVYARCTPPKPVCTIQSVPANAPRCSSTTCSDQRNPNQTSHRS
jgi:hypothetical protein